MRSFRRRANLAPSHFSQLLFAVVAAVSPSGILQAATVHGEINLTCQAGNDFQSITISTAASSRANSRYEECVARGVATSAGSGASFDYLLDPNQLHLYITASAMREYPAEGAGSSSGVEVEFHLPAPGNPRPGWLRIESWICAGYVCTWFPPQMSVEWVPVTLGTLLTFEGSVSASAGENSWTPAFGEYYVQAFETTALGEIGPRAYLFSEVPEPTTALLLLCGGVLAAVRCRIKRC